MLLKCNLHPSNIRSAYDPGDDFQPASAHGEFVYSAPEIARIRDHRNRLDLAWKAINRPGFKKSRIEPSKFDRKTDERTTRAQHPRSKNRLPPNFRLLRAYLSVSAPLRAKRPPSPTPPRLVRRPRISTLMARQEFHMKRLIALFLICAGAALAADATGTWKASIETPNGNIETTLRLEGRCRKAVPEP